MSKSTVVDNDTGKSVDSTVRTSTGTFFGRGQDEVIAAVEKRVSLVSESLLKAGPARYSCSWGGLNVLLCTFHAEVCLGIAFNRGLLHVMYSV